MFNQNCAMTKHLACEGARAILGASLSNLETVVENPPIFRPPTQVHHVFITRHYPT
ncbi:hypothetical protein SBC1_64430 (plasmid) [Caballeronia sp. SBC1]|nr:hypothetical protein SBC2_64150 [Caballeronia sp. SBC2]QIN66396.1 hypothetical protein SBC1_64430 [Caballeronia sp. SBC1]